MTWPFLCILEKSSITKKFDRKVDKCKQYKRIPWNKEHVNCFLTIDCNVNLLLVHKINQKTLLKPSSPETWRMTITQQQQKRKILSLGQLLRPNHIDCTPQSNTIRRPRPTVMHFHTFPWKKSSKNKHLPHLMTHFEYVASELLGGSALSFYTTLVLTALGTWTA